MSNKVFQQNLDDKKGPQPGGPLSHTDAVQRTGAHAGQRENDCRNGKHIGATECFCYDKKMAGFAALDHIANFRTASSRYS